jgi:hypothetical protein
MGGGPPRSSCLGGESYSSPGRSQFTDSLAPPHTQKAYRSSTTLTLPQKTTSEITVAIMVLFGLRTLERSRRRTHFFFS